MSDLFEMILEVVKWCSVKTAEISNDSIVYVLECCELEDERVYLKGNQAPLYSSTYTPARKVRKTASAIHAIICTR